MRGKPPLNKKNMFASLRRCDDLLGMHGVRRGQNNSVDRGICKQCFIAVGHGYVVCSCEFSRFCRSARGTGYKLNVWRESLNEESGNFGIESCQRIAEIINKKYRNLEYQHLIYKETS